MGSRFVLAMLFIAVLADGQLFAQDSDSSEIIHADSIRTTRNTMHKDSIPNSHYEIELEIEELTGTNKIGQFFHKYRYRLAYSLDSFPEEKIDEYVADMRARRSIKSTVYSIYRPIPIREWPWIMEFSNNNYSNFQPVNPLVIFGY